MNRKEILEKYPPHKDNMLLILHELQDNNPERYLSEADMKAVASYLRTTYSHVYGVVTYYTMYSLKPRGRYIIRLCNSPVCNMQGSENVISELAAVLGVNPGETTGDGLFTLEYSECLGQCGGAPGMMVNEDVHTNLSSERIRKIIEYYKSK